MICKAIIYNSDLDNLAKKSSLSSDEAFLLRFKNALETRIQANFYVQFMHLKTYLILKYQNIKMEFVQIDNGANLTSRGKLQKFREGTQKGFPDVMILLSIKSINRVIFIETKRIGTPSQIKISPDQEIWQEKLTEMHWKSYITNNPVFFRQKICQEIENFFNFYTVDNLSHPNTNLN